MGFACNAVGVKSKKIDRIKEIAQIINCQNMKSLRYFLDKELNYSQEKLWVYDAYSINNDAIICDNEREKKLIKLGKENSVLFEFYN